MSDHQDDLDTLRRQGYRLTSQRVFMLEVLKGKAGHVSAETLHADIVARYPLTNVATVYRNLHWLHGAGMVRKIDLGRGHLLWEYAGASFHHHLICQACDAVQEIDNHVVECLSDHVRHHYGFEVNLNHLAIFGRCAACQAELGAGPACDENGDDPGFRP